MSNLYGTEVAGNPATSQVYQATHNGNKRSSYIKRSFISFSYGGRYIEDLGFIVSIDGDRINRPAYGNFEDIVTDSNIVDGQYYWDTHFSNNELSLTLATDGITQNQIDDFKNWLKPGQARELILSEHPNRGIMARVSQAPDLQLLPFETEATVMIGGREYYTSTTLYKGTATVTFIADDPFWYSLSNLLCYTDGTNIDYDKWLDANGIAVYNYEDPDALKIILEDGIPTNSMLSENMLIGNKIISTSDMAERSKIQSQKAKLNDVDNEIDTALIGLVMQETNGLNFGAGENNSIYFYYPGTAYCYPTLYFSLTPTFDNDGYINIPNNIYSSTGENSYNTITIESTTKKTFCFTTPSVFTAYNQAIKIFKEMDGDAAIEVRAAIRDNVNHYAARAYAISIIPTSGNINSSDMITSMKNFLQNNNVISPVNFKINCETGETTGIFNYYYDGKFIETEEQVGDMIRSNYIKLEEKNSPINGYVVPWSQEHPNSSYRMYHDVPNGLSNVLLEYRYKYL